MYLLLSTERDTADTVSGGKNFSLICFMRNAPTRDGEQHVVEIILSLMRSIPKARSKTAIFELLRHDDLHFFGRLKKGVFIEHMNIKFLKDVF